MVKAFHILPNMQPILSMILITIKMILASNEDGVRFIPLVKGHFNFRNNVFKKCSLLISSLILPIGHRHE